MQAACDAVKGRTVGFQLSIGMGLKEYDPYSRSCCAYERYRSFQGGLVYQSCVFE